LILFISFLGFTSFVSNSSNISSLTTYHLLISLCIGLFTFVLSCINSSVQDAISTLFEVNLCIFSGFCSNFSININLGNINSLLNLYFVSASIFSYL